MFLTIAAAAVIAGAERLKLVVVEGEGALNSIEARRAKEPVVRVVDDEDVPVPGAVVNFILPAQGAGGYFMDREASLTVTTGADGLATGRGLKPNGTAGPFVIRVTASWRGETATANIHQTNVAPAARGNGKKIALIALIGGAAVAGLVAATRGSDGPAANSAASAGRTTVQSGTPVFGPPR